MKSFRPLAFLLLVAICVVFTVAVAATPTRQGDNRGNSYHSFTKAHPPDDSGVVAIPLRFKWSVETGSSGFDLRGNPLPDPRVMLRLHDPNEPWTTAFIAQMDLATAVKLHHELGDIIVKKLENPNFHHHPQYYDPKKIPTGRFKGIDENGKAIIELEYPKTKPGE